VKLAWIGAEKAFPIEVVCTVRGVSRSGFDAWKRRSSSAASKKRARVAAEIVAGAQKERMPVRKSARPPGACPSRYSITI
jgi:hypothetical protein